MFLVSEQTIRAERSWIEYRWICIYLQDEREIHFPAHKNKRLSKASSEQLSKVELICGGTGLHWSSLDEDLSVVGILEGRLG